MKIFCIGLNKTGTTSLKHLFEKEGIKVANQSDFEKMTAKFYKNPDSILKIIDKVNPNITTFFQDIPFAIPGFWKLLVDRYPDSKFILSVRDSAEQYYNSLVNFHTKSWGNVFDPNILKKIKYVQPGFSYTFMVDILGCPPEDPYNKEYLTRMYDRHQFEIEDFFRNNLHNQFIKINLANEDDFVGLNNFLGLNFKSTKFPHLHSFSYVD